MLEPDEFQQRILNWFDQHIASALSDNDALGMAGMLKAAIGVKEKQAEGGEEDAAPEPTTLLAKGEKTDEVEEGAAQ